MDQRLAELVQTCQTGAAELRDMSWATVDTSRRVKAGVDLRVWRQRLEETAKGIEFCGGYLFVYSEHETNQHLVRVGKLLDHATTLIELVTQLPASTGRQYACAVREAAAATLNALSRLPELYRTMRHSRQTPATFVWNQTLRLRDIPETCLTHLMMRWERWSAQLREACEEFKQIYRSSAKDACEEPADGQNDDENNISAEGFLKEVWTSRAPEALTYSELATVRDCESLVRLVRSLFRKIRVRCISSLHPANPEDIRFIDDVFLAGEQLVGLVDDLAAQLLPPHDMISIISIATKITRQGLRLVDLAAQRCPETHSRWFFLCTQHLDDMLFPLFERNPIR